MQIVWQTDGQIVTKDDDETCEPTLADGKKKHQL